MPLLPYHPIFTVPCGLYLPGMSKIHLFPSNASATTQLLVIIMPHLETTVASSLVSGFHSCPANPFSPHSHKDLLELQI